MRCRRIACRLLPLVAVVSVVACTHPPASPSPPLSSMSLTVVAPQQGSVVTLPQAYPYILPGGLVIPKDSPHVSVRVDMSTMHDVPWGQLNVYLLTGGTTTEYCGQNTPDSPTWGFLPKGWSTSVTMTGFRVYRLPCPVTGFHAVFHTRNNGTLTPPTAAETIVGATVNRAFTLVR